MSSKGECTVRVRRLKGEVFLRVSKSFEQLYVGVGGAIGATTTARLHMVRVRRPEDK